MFKVGYKKLKKKQFTKSFVIWGKVMLFNKFREDKMLDFKCKEIV